MLLIINAVNTASKYFQVLGDVTAEFGPDDYIQINKSTGNNGIYRLAAAAYSAGVTRLTTVEPIPSAVADGVIAGGVYELLFSQASIPGKSSLVIPPYGINASTSLVFNGKASLNFGEHQQRNILRILENFASSVGPDNPTVGQHWYDYTNRAMNVYNGTGWSTDVNVETGTISFRDPQHGTAGARYFLTGSEPVAAKPGITLYPSTNPVAGTGMFNIADANGNSVLTVEFNGNTISTNALEITSAATSSFVGAAAINTSSAGTVGLTVNKDVSVISGNVNLGTNGMVQVAGGARVTLNSAVLLRGSSTTTGVVVQSTSGTTVAVFGDTNTTFNGLTSFTNTVTLVDASVTGTATIAALSATSQTTSGAATFQGETTIETAPTTALHAANKAYVDTAAAAQSAQSTNNLIINWIGV